MNYKPFDLELSLKGKCVITREGIPVTALYHFAKTKKICAEIENNVMIFGENGRFCESVLNESRNDLFMAPVTIERWVNVYSYGYEKYTTGGVTYNTKEESESNKGSGNHIGTFPIQITL